MFTQRELQKRTNCSCIVAFDSARQGDSRPGEQRRLGSVPLEQPSPAGGVPALRVKFCNTHWKVAADTEFCWQAVFEIGLQRVRSVGGLGMAVSQRQDAMKWEIVGRKPGDRKDTRFEVSAATSAEAVAEAITWGWVVKSFRPVERPAQPGQAPQLGEISQPAQRSMALWAIAGFVLVIGMAAGAFVVLRPGPKPAVASPTPHLAVQPPLVVAPAAAPATPETRVAELAPPPAPQPAQERPNSPPAAPHASVSAPAATDLLRPTAAQSTAVKYVASRVAGPFHLPTCPSAQRISANNLETFETREAAIAAGHTPCKVCNP
jgi:hypothetical protein